MNSLKPEQQSRLLASAINNLSAGVVITDPNQPDNPIVFVNSSFTAITGYSAEEAMGRNCRFLQGVDTDRQTLDDLRAALAAHRPWNGLLQNYHKDGSSFSTGLVITPVFGDDGELQHFVGLLNDVSASREQLRALAARLTSAREEERTQMAREIHDVLGQSLTGLKMDVSWLGKRISALPDSDTATVLFDKICAMAQLIDNTIGTVRKIASDLRPGLLDDLGLEAAAEWQVKEFQNRSGIACRFVSTMKDTPVSPDSSTALFRILNETLTNVARHAAATRVEVRLSTKGRNAVLQVRDNGRGISGREATNTKSLGLLGMRERALLLGGTVEITGAPQKGTTVRVVVPLQAELQIDSLEGAGA
jgi:PAS domain S-box-containing protein